MLLPRVNANRRRPRWHRWRTRVWLFSHRHNPLVLVLLLVMVLYGLYTLGLPVVVVSHRRRAWHVAPVPPQDVETFCHRLWLETQRLDPDNRRGIVLPLFNDIALLGFSLVRELRRLQVTLPVEIPHCGDLSVALQRKLHDQDEHVTFLDVCDLAAEARAETRPLFCMDRTHCREKFRSFDIKVLALVYSRFEEIMLLDADTLFLQSPTSLWETSKYKSTGTLFFNDRISFDLSYLADRKAFDKEVQVDASVGALHWFLASFDVTPYRHFGTVDKTEWRPQLSRRRFFGLEFGFQPSAFLLNSHVWKLRSGHQMDSSLVLWNKVRQPRATAILASFISLNGLPTVPSYGDKELYWIACELAETAYAFSDYAVGTVGRDLLASGQQNDGVLCGDALQHYPVQLDTTKGLEADVAPLYINSDNILEWGRDSRHLYRTAARPADLYPGSSSERKLEFTCLFNVTTMGLAPLETKLLKQRQQYYDMTKVGWIEWYLFT